MSGIVGRVVPQAPKEHVLAQLKDVPWAIKLINDPSYQACTPQSRLVKPTGTGDLFVARTLDTPSTISAWQTLRSIPAPSLNNGEVLNILKIGPGVNGHIDLCHGGFVSLLLDEVLGTAADHARPEGLSSMTAYLHVDYKSPIQTPTTVLCRAVIERIEGRKIFARGSVEDGLGKVYARGNAMFVIVPLIMPATKL